MTSKKIIALVVLGLVAFTVVLALILAPDGETPGRLTPGPGEVGVIHIDGVIVGGRGNPFGTYAGSEEIAALLREASRNPALKAVVLRLNSPGGSAAGSQEIGAEVARLKQSGKKVVASMGDVAASGAYWIAAGADRIVANPATITGSIGVIITHTDLQGLYGKLGIETDTFKSGPHKDMGSPDRSLTAAERDILQGMIDDIYEQFVDVVAEGRNRDRAEITALADGRIYTGRQAKELGLVDELGDFHDAVLLAGQLAGIPGEPNVTELKTRSIWRDMFGGMSSINFGGRWWSPLPSQDGQFHYLYLR